MKRMLKRLLKRLGRPLFEELTRTLEARLEKLEETLGASVDNEAVAQKTLMHHYRLLAGRGNGWTPSIRDVGFRKYSQFEEDGILLCIFSLVPPINRTCVEICAGNGRECNTANLIINHGWWGHLFDGDDRNVKAGLQFFGQGKDTFLHPPRFTKAWITAESVNDQIAASGVSGEIDLLSLDIDGMDYWVWKAITVIQPRVVVCETHNVIPPGMALTVPYDPAFVSESPDYRGASLEGMCKLGREKGYRLVGTHRFGFNAFFIKNGLGETLFPEVDVESCVRDPFSELARRERWPQVKDDKWEEV